MRREEGGYVAIMTTILMSMVLLAMIAEEGTLGWNARFVALNNEKKRQADMLTRGCVDAAIAALIQNPAQDISSMKLLADVCEVYEINTTDQHAVELFIQSRVGNAESGGVAYTNMKVIADFGDIHLGVTPLIAAPTPTLLSVKILSQEELPSL